mmetsp:Transcript_4836/g.30744  ORF Transcript_4836/g.30744 Transcript_4836/m.30744 type:complete len:580 (+) Transcript_4836:2541-4280(+)
MWTPNGQCTNPTGQCVSYLRGSSAPRLCRIQGQNSIMNRGPESMQGHRSNVLDVYFPPHWQSRRRIERSGGEEDAAAFCGSVCPSNFCVQGPAEGKHLNWSLSFVQSLKLSYHRAKSLAGIFEGGCHARCLAINGRFSYDAKQRLFRRWVVHVDLRELDNVGFSMPHQFHRTTTFEINSQGARFSYKRFGPLDRAFWLRRHGHGGPHFSFVSPSHFRACIHRTHFFDVPFHGSSRTWSKISAGDVMAGDGDLRCARKGMCGTQQVGSDAQHQSTHGKHPFHWILLRVGLCEQSTVSQVHVLLLGGCFGQERFLGFRVLLEPLRQLLLALLLPRERHFLPAACTRACKSVLTRASKASTIVDLDSSSNAKDPGKLSDELTPSDPVPGREETNQSNWTNGPVGCRSTSASQRIHGEGMLMQQVPREHSNTSRAGVDQPLDNAGRNGGYRCAGKDHITDNSSTHTTPDWKGTTPPLEIRSSKDQSVQGEKRNRRLWRWGGRWASWRTALTFSVYDHPRAWIVPATPPRPLNLPTPNSWENCMSCRYATNNSCTEECTGLPGLLASMFVAGPCLDRNKAQSES